MTASSPMDPASSFGAFTKVVNKHVLGSPERFQELKERMTMCEYATSKAGAAALGYLMAMEEKENENCPWEAVKDLIEHSTDSATAADQIMTIIYHWVDKVIEKENINTGDYVRGILREAFEMYVIP